MPSKNHPDYREEYKRIEYTLGYVEKSLKASQREKQRIDEEVTSRLSKI